MAPLYKSKCTACGYCCLITFANPPLFGSYGDQIAAAVAAGGLACRRCGSATEVVLSESSREAASEASPKVPFRVGDKVAIQKFGWEGQDRVAEVNGEHVRIEAKMMIFGEERAVWFHYAELRAAP